MMKFTGKVIRISKNGKIKIPQMLLEIAGIQKKEFAEILRIDNGIVIQKKELVCLVTGERSNEVIEVVPGITLSPKGMEILLKELQEKANNI